LQFAVFEFLFFSVNVKWGKEKFTDVECNTDESPELFKAQLFALSGVAPDRQKVMITGAIIKDDWGAAGKKLKDGCTVLMMGTADALPQAPAQKPVFVEDMSETQLNAALSVPSGLTNLGNTCYMNATVQCLRVVPELKDALQKFTGGLSVVPGELNAEDSITAALRDLYKSMEKSSAAIPPIIFLQVLHMVFPQFAEKGENGGYQQQDANECWTQIVRSLQQKLKAIEGGPEAMETDAGASASAQTAGFIDQYFGGEFESTMKCTEAPDEGESKSSEKFLQLSCFIQQGGPFFLRFKKSKQNTKYCIWHN